MKRNILVLSAALLTLAAVLPAPGRTQTLSATVRGTVFDLEDKPVPDVFITFKNKSNGQTLQTKTGKDGRYLQIGLASGDYTINFKKTELQLNYDEIRTLRVGDELTVDVNLKNILAKQGPSAEEIKKREEAAQKFHGMKAHFDLGRAAVDQGNALRAQVQTTPPDQRAALQEKMNGFYQTAVNEFQQAQQAAKENEPNLHMVEANLGNAYESVGQYDKAAEAFQKAVDLRPLEANYYIGLGTNLARIGKLDEANAACDKAGAINPASSGICLRNLGIVLRNAGKMQEAQMPLQKAIKVDPQNPDGWYLLATAMLGSIDSKQEGDKLIYIIPPGTADMYQKYLDLAPNGPHAQEAKDALTNLASLGQGVDTKVSTRKKK